MRRAALIAAMTALAAAAAFGRHGTLLQQAPPTAARLANPFDSEEDARLAGAKLYRRNCAACHGAAGEGRPGIPPLNRPDVRAAPPGALFWVLRNGSLKRGMPSFAHLPEPERWQIVTWIRSLRAATPKETQGP